MYISKYYNYIVLSADTRYIMHPGPDFRSPQTTVSASRIDGGTPQNYISPSIRKHIGITSPATFITPEVVNDDEKERRDRRRSKVLELQRRHLQSPATPSDRYTDHILCYILYSIRQVYRPHTVLYFILHQTGIQTTYCVIFYQQNLIE